MIKVGVLDDYQDVFRQIIDVESYKNKFDFQIFNEPLLNENEAIISLEKFELYHFVGATFIVSGIYFSNKKTND